MSVDKVKKYFAGYGMESRVLEFDVSSATVELAYKATFGKKAKMLTQEQVTELIGHAVAINPGVDIYLDASLKKYETAFPACGSSNSAIELTIPEMEKYSGYKEWIDVCKPR